VNDTLAAVGSRVITVGIFTESYKTKIVQFGLTDNVDTRLGYLDNLVNDEIFIAQAKRDKLDRTNEAKKELALIQQQELLNDYTQRHIVPTVEVTEDDLREFYIMLNTKIKVRHLYAPTKKEADLLYSELQGGQTFLALAKHVFTDPVLRDNGGLLGYIEVDEMDPDFEKAAFGLEIGETSKPVKTVQGYSIIQVEDIRRNPFVTEYEYASSKERLQAFVRKRKLEETVKSHTAQLRTDLDIRINDALLSRLFRMTQQTSWQHVIEQPATTFSSNELSKIIVERPAKRANQN
jgi:parvulin-like peptidyl-prolyl isomerase